MVALTNFSRPSDRIRHEQPNTTVFVNDNNIGKGTLFIAESYLSWGSDSGNGFTLEYPHISLHAISRDTAAFPHECILMMLDTDFNGESEISCIESNDTDDQITTEIRLVPDDKGMLDAIFHALNICQTLHPDPDDSFSDDLSDDADADDDFCVDNSDSQVDGRIREIDEDPYNDDNRIGVLCEEEDFMETDRVGGVLEDVEDLRISDDIHDYTEVPGMYEDKEESL